MGLDVSLRPSHFINNLNTVSSLMKTNKKESTRIQRIDEAQKTSTSIRR